jgi:modulator of FtsH protease
MALFDQMNQNRREGARVVYSSQEHTHTRSDANTFLKQTYQLFASSLLAGTVGAYVGLGIADVVSSWYIAFIILEFALLFGVFATKRINGVNLLMLFSFTFITGLTLAPLLSRILGMAGGASIVANAFMLTTVIFAGLSIYAMSTKTNYMNIGKGLMIALIIVIVASIVNIFIGSPILHIVISGISALIFSAFILYDTQNIISGNYETPIEGAIALYLDFLNLFISLLQILGIMGGNDD